MAHPATSVNPGDSILFSGYDVFRKREVSERGGLPLAGADHPSQERNHGIPFRIVHNAIGNHKPRERRNRASGVNAMFSVTPGRFTIGTTAPTTEGKNRYLASSR
jgi:hypothetical protein